MLVQLHYGRPQGLFDRPELRALAGATAVTLATLTLGLKGPSMPGLWQLLSPPGLVALMGLVVAGSAGLLSFHLAALADRTNRRVAFAHYALPAALIPAAALPGIGIAAWLPPLAIATLLASTSREQRFAAIFGQCGACAGGAAAFLNDVPLGSYVTVTMLALAWVLARNRGKAAANDNPCMERGAQIWRLPPDICYATQA